MQLRTADKKGGHLMERAATGGRAPRVGDAVRLEPHGDHFRWLSQNRPMAFEDQPLGLAILSSHAVIEMARRGVSEGEVRAVLSDPRRQAAVVRPGRIILTSLLVRDLGRRVYVVRVVVDLDRAPPVVVTAYRSSKIAKYWSQP